MFILGKHIIESVIYHCNHYFCFHYGDCYHNCDYYFSDCHNQTNISYSNLKDTEFLKKVYFESIN